MIFMLGSLWTAHLLFSTCCTGAIIKATVLLTPFLVNSEIAAAIYSAETLDDASIGATMVMHGFLMKELGMNEHEAGMLLSVAGDLRICQIADPEKTCRTEIPMSIMQRYHDSFQ